MARDLLEGAQWEAARAAYEETLARADDPEAHDGLGLALWFLGEVEEGVASRERAFDAYVRDGRCDDAARVAVWVAHQRKISGRTSAARGWLARAERALEGQDACAGHGWVAVERAGHAASAEECAGHARRAMEFARKAGDGDLEVLALSVLGGALVTAGRPQEGMALLEEALAAASAGRAHNVHTLGSAYCNLIVACVDAGEWERATEWCELVDDFARDHRAAPLLGACQTIHADVLVARGRWDDAERSLQSAIATHERYVPEMGAPSAAALAELRVRQGRLGEAEQLLADRREHPSSLRAMALLAMARGEPATAASLLERGLMAAGDDVVRTTQLLAPLVDARLVSGAVDGAAEAAEQLRALAETSGLRLVAARADLAAARVALARGEASAVAAEAARSALAAFGALAMPLDAGEARLELARALASSALELAIEEARNAQAAFRELGAARALDAAAAVLRELGTGSAPRERVQGELSAREREVLALLEQGMSNARIAQTLVISEKTAGHHVSRILAKLGVRNRTEAAAYAARARAV
jgi:ATP/maltotriose-dependent transcriptional regulator MalT